MLWFCDKSKFKKIKDFFEEHLRKSHKLVIFRAEIAFLPHGTVLAQVTRIATTEEITMNARINEATLSGLTRNDEQTSEAINRARYAMLNELPGLVFGILTIAWIATSLISLV
jgi:hypothetical protein